MSLTAREIEDVVAELKALEDGFIQKVYVPEPRTVLLDVRRPGASHLLLVCAEAGRTRLHVASTRPPSPEPPYAFQGLLRAELLGMAIETVEAVPGERMARIRLRSRERPARTLVAELIGRHGNLFLLDENDAVRGSAIPNLSTVRDNRSGQAYVPPLARTEVAADDTRTRFAPGETPFSLSAAIEQAYAGRERREIAVERRRALLQPLKARRQRVVRTLEKVAEDVQRAGRAEEHLRRGELLKANLGRLKRGMKEVRLTEYTAEGVEEVVIALDPTRTPKENLDREFHQYRRLLAGQARARARLEELKGELAGVEARLAEVEAMDDEALLAARPSGAVERKPAPRRFRPDKPARPFREYLSPSGQRIRVGRGAKENDALTFRYSRGNDVWLHARNVPGAHVVVPLEREEVLKEETLRDAALLAAHNSDARGAAVVDVAWTRVKHVHKTRGVLGAVTYTQDKTFGVRPEPERLGRLVETE